MKGTEQHTTSSLLRRWMGKGFTTFLVVAASIGFYFLLLRLGEINRTVREILGYLRAVWYGLALAFILNPLMKWVERHLTHLIGDRMNEKARWKASRMGGIFAAVALLVLVVVLLFNMILPELYHTIRRLIIILPRELNQMIRSLQEINTESTLGKYGQALAERANLSFQEFLRGDFLGGLDNLMENVTTGVIGAVGTLVNMLIGLILACYVLFSKEKFAGQSKKILYAIFRRERANEILDLCRKSNQIFSNFLIGKLIDSLIIGILCFFGMSVFRISDQYTLLVSVVVGVTNIIPFFGPYVGAVPSALLIFLENPMHGVYFLLFIIALQQFDGNILGPKILGDSTGLSAFWVVFSILLFGGMFGFIGMVIGVPLFAVIYYIVSNITSHRLAQKNLPTDTKSFVDLAEVDQGGTVRKMSEMPNVHRDLHVWRPGFLKKKKTEESETDNKKNDDIDDPS